MKLSDWRWLVVCIDMCIEVYITDESVRCRAASPGQVRTEDCSQPGLHSSVGCPPSHQPVNCDPLARSDHSQSVSQSVTLTVLSCYVTPHVVLILTVCKLGRQGGRLANIEMCNVLSQHHLTFTGASLTRYLSVVTLSRTTQPT